MIGSDSPNLYHEKFHAPTQKDTLVSRKSSNHSCVFSYGHMSQSEQPLHVRNGNTLSQSQAHSSMAEYAQIDIIPSTNHSAHITGSPYHLDPYQKRANQNEPIYESIDVSMASSQR